MRFTSIEEALHGLDRTESRHDLLYRLMLSRPVDNELLGPGARLRLYSTGFGQLVNSSYSPLYVGTASKEDLATILVNEEVKEHFVSVSYFSWPNKELCRELNVRDYRR